MTEPPAAQAESQGGLLRSPIAWGVLGVVVVVGLIAAEVAWTAPVRDAVRSYSELVSAANVGDLDAVREHCSAAYLKTHKLRAADEGGVVGLPRSIHKNFQVWRDGRYVLLCPTNRIGPVYRFVHEQASWRFDGPIGLLMPGGRVSPMADIPAGGSP